MKKGELVDFCKKFGVKQEDIDQFMKKKKLKEVDGNVFLTSSSLGDGQVGSSGMIFIKLISRLPTTYLLRFIAGGSKCLEVKTEKNALSFTYSKNLEQKCFTNANNLINGGWYALKFGDVILGYGKFDLSGKRIVNLMNIGEYLKES